MSGDSDYSTQMKENVQGFKPILEAGGFLAEWKIMGVPKPLPKSFEDHATVDNFYGVIFKRDNLNHFYPPSGSGLVHDDRYPKNAGFWKEDSVVMRATTRTLVEHGRTAPKSSDELRGWSSAELARILLEGANLAEIIACLSSQLYNVKDEQAQDALRQLTNLMETTSEHVERPAKGSKSKSAEESLEESFQGLSVQTPKKMSPKAKPKSPPKSPPRAKSPPKSSGNPNSNSAKEAELVKLMARYNKMVQEKKSTQNIADSIKRLAAELGHDDDYMADKHDFYGFGRSGLKPLRRRMSRRLSFKRTKMLLRRTSGHKKRRPSRRRSLKKMMKRTSKKKSGKPSRPTKFKKSFGSSIYGLQGGLQSGPVYSGVYPMTLRVNESFPNLNNVKRTYALNEFGTKKLRRKQSKKLVVPDRRGRKVLPMRFGSGSGSDSDSDSGSDSEGSGGSGCGSCGRSFGCCGCGGKDEE